MIYYLLRDTAGVFARHPRMRSALSPSPWTGRAGVGRTAQKPAVSYKRELSDEGDAMDQETLWRQYMALPVDAQRQVVDFIAFLATRYRTAPSVKPSQVINLVDEPFVGMWADRD